MDLLRRLFGTTAIRGWSVASLVANGLLIVTGGIVRLTGSGLGCPTWPKCDETGYIPHPALGIHGVIEFGNRLLTFVLIVIAVATLVAAWRARTAGLPRRDLRILAVAAAAGIPLQGVIGGITVLVQLNPWVVGLHMVLSVILVAVCTTMVHRAWDVAHPPVPRAASTLMAVAFCLAILAVLTGIVTTGAGPHAGDGGAARNGLPLELVARVHATSVWLLIGVTVVTLFLTRARAVLVLLAVIALQGVIGYVQYFTGLPIALVAAHLAGVALLTTAATHALIATRPPAQARMRTLPPSGVPATKGSNAL